MQTRDGPALLKMKWLMISRKIIWNINGVPFVRDYFFPVTMECKESPPHKAFLNYYLRKNEIKTRETISMYVCGWMYGISS